MLSRIFLKSQGYIHYEVSNFAKPGFESKHNLKYWNAESVAAIGPSATGFLMEKSLRYKWKNKSLNFEIERLSKEQLELEKLFLKLRTNLGINVRDFYNSDKANKIHSITEKWQDLGLLDSNTSGLGSDQIILNSAGMLQMDNLINELFLVDKTL